MTAPPLQERSQAVDRGRALERLADLVKPDTRVVLKSDIILARCSANGSAHFSV